MLSAFSSRSPVGSVFALGTAGASPSTTMIAGSPFTNQTRNLTPEQMNQAKLRGAAISARLHPDIRRTLNKIRSEPQRATLKKPVIPMGKSLYFSNMTRRQRVLMFQTCQTLNLQRLEALRQKGVDPDTKDENNALFNAALFEKSVGGVWRWESPKKEDKGTSIDVPDYVENAAEPWKPKALAQAHKLWEESIERSRYILNGPVDSKYWKLNAISNLQTWQGEKTNEHLTSLEGTLRRLLQEVEKAGKGVSNPHIRILFQMLNRHHPELMTEGKTGRQLETLGKLFKATSFHLQWAIRAVYAGNKEIRRRVLEQCTEETMFRLHLEKMLAWSPEIRLLQGGYRSIQLQATSEYRLSKSEAFQLLIDGLVQQRQVEMLGARDSKDKKMVLRTTGDQLEELKNKHGGSIFQWKKKKHKIVKRSIVEKWDDMALYKREKLEIVTSFYTPINKKKKSAAKKAPGLNPFRRFFMPKESIRIRFEKPGIGEEDLLTELVETYNSVFKAFFRSESAKIKRQEDASGKSMDLRLNPRDVYMQVLEKWMDMSRKDQTAFKNTTSQQGGIITGGMFPLLAGPGSSNESDASENAKKDGSKKSSSSGSQRKGDSSEISVEELLKGDGPAILGV